MTAQRTFETLRSRDVRNERRIFWSELATIVIVALLATAYLITIYGSFRSGNVPAPRP